MSIVFKWKLPLEFDPIVRGVNTCRLLRFSFPSFLFFFFFQLLFFTCADRKVHVAFFRFQCHFGMLTFTVSKEIFRCPNTYYAKICKEYEKDKFCFVCFQPDLSSTEKWKLLKFFKSILLLRFVFSYLHGQNKYKIRVSVHYSFLTKKLFVIKVTKMYFCGSKYAKGLFTNYFDKFLAFLTTYPPSLTVSSL